MAAGDITDTLRDDVRSRLGQWSLKAVEDDVIFFHLSRAQENLLIYLPDAAIPYLTDTASGNLTNSRVGLPSDFCRERLVLFGDDEIEAKPWDITELDVLDYHTPSATNPYYCIFYSATDEAVRLLVDVGDATSTAAYKVLYVKTPPTLTTEVDPIVSAALYPLLVDFAVRRCRETRTEWDEAERMRLQLGGRIGVIRSRYAPGPVSDGRPGDL